MIAVLPAAGRGTRMASLGLGPKELLPLGGKSALQWTIEEARATGIDEISIVSSPDKPEIAQGFAECEIVEQDPPNGLAPAVLAASRLRPVLLLLPDTIFYP